MGKPLRVLIVEDSRADAQLVLHELRQGGYEPTCEIVDAPEAMNETLDEQEWDIVLADYVMPNFGGLAALGLLKAKGIDLPFIIVSGAIGEDMAVAAMKAGAQDYIMKGNLTRLVPAVERELREAEVRRERRRAEQERDRLVEQMRNVNGELVLRSIHIQEQAAEVEAIVAALAEAVVVFGPGGEIMRLNPAAGDLLGYSSTEPKKPIQKQLAQLRMETAEAQPFPPRDVPTALVMRGETVRGMVAIIHRIPDEKPVWVSISAAPVLAADGKPRGGVAIFTDVTALHEQQGATGPKA